LLGVVMKYTIWSFVDWVKQAEILLLENLGYHNRKPNISRLLMRISPKQETCDIPLI